MRQQAFLCRHSDLNASLHPREENGYADLASSRRQTRPRTANKQMSLYEEPISSSEEDFDQSEGMCYLGILYLIWKTRLGLLQILRLFFE